MSLEPPIIWPWPFLMTPAQHRATANQLRQSGNPQLATQHDSLAKVIAKRSATGRNSSPLFNVYVSVLPEHYTSAHQLQYAVEREADHRNDDESRHSASILE